MNATKVAIRLVDYGDARRVDELCPPEVFTAAERLYCARSRSLDGWAGVLAAKQAAAEVLGVACGPNLEVRRDVRGCPDGGGCGLGHPPVVALAGEVVESVSVSVAHDGCVAAAVAVERAS